jgi:prepilin-type processing-associated H-X9-DG protein
MPTAGGNGYSGVRTATSGVPVAGKDQLWGWLYQILPYEELSNVWTLNTDDAVKQTYIKIYFCPSRRPKCIRPLPNGTLNDYVGNAGAGVNANSSAGFSVSGFTPLSSDYANRGGYGVIVALGGNPAVQPVRVAIITDGTSNTMLAAEKALSTAMYAGGDGNDNQGFWRGMDSDITGGVYQPVSPASPPPYKLQQDTKWFVPGGATNTYNYSLNFSMYGSAHPGGVNTVMCDGSVRLLRYTIDINSALVPLCVRDDGLSFNADNL